MTALTASGLSGALLATLLISLTGLLTCLLILGGRGRSLDGTAASRQSPVSRAAGWPQGLLILGGMAASAGALRALPPSGVPALTGNWPTLIGILSVLAFVFLIGERLVRAIPVICLPERDALGALLRLPAAALLAYAALFAARSIGLPLGAWFALLIDAYIGLVTAELALRTLAIWFLPPRAPLDARAMIGSLTASLLLPGSVQPSRVAAKLKTQFGIDISRSWALGYARVATAPVLLGLLVFTWCLSGVVRVGLDARGSYERFGAPVAILTPGLHILLPWPFGRVRVVEYGIVHAVALESGSGSGAVASDTSTADGPAPPSANRLWDQRFINEASYIIASTSDGRQSFETASVKINVLYRVGLTDEDARLAVYSLVDPATLVRSVAGQELARFFVDRTLTQVLGEPNEEIAGGLRDAVQRDLDAQHSGLEVLALIVESLHPPGGAAAAYRSVQTSQIVASMQYSQEQGRAQTTLSVAQSDAHRMHDQAQAAAAERIESAREEQLRSAADILAYREGGRAFLLERYFHNLRTALAAGSADIVDSRLGQGQGAIFDLRPASAAFSSPLRVSSYQGMTP
ncbi:MAG TPA: SPFH domain-containing protein [Acidisoma sp.]|nr:SPFH domain-containing protein [Acidisoma sp.]